MPQAVEAAGLEAESDELRFCRVLQNLRERPGLQAALDASLADDIFGETSSLVTEARARAAALIAQAKAEGAYPKRRPGDRP